MATMSLQLKQAIALAKAGQNDQARLLVEKAIEEDPDNANAWLLLSTLVETQEEQVQSLNRVLAIDPDHGTARKRLSKIGPILSGEETGEISALFEDETVVAEMDDIVPEPTDEVPATVITAAPHSLDEAESSPEVMPEDTIDESPGQTDEMAEEAAGESVAEQAEEPDLDSQIDVLLTVDQEQGDDGLTTMVSPVVLDAIEEDQDEAQDEVRREEAEPIPETVISATPAPAEQGIPDEQQPKTALEETLEMPDEDLEGLISIGEPSVDLPDLDDIPDWLRDEGGYAEPGSELRTIAPASEEKPMEETHFEEIPGWLQEGPGEEWLEKSKPTVHEKAIDTARNDERILRATVAGATEPGDDEDLEQPGRRKRPRLSTRTLEIVLGILIILALLIVAALAYVVVYVG